MKKTIIWAILLIPFTVFSQQNISKSPVIDDRLYAAYEKAYVDKVAQEDLFLIKRWTYYLDHAYYVTDALVSKDGVVVDYPSVSVPDLANLNILKLETEQNLKRDYYQEMIYQIKGTNKFLIYHSGRNFIENFNAYLATKQGDK